jgi:hypothetical protein
LSTSDHTTLSEYFNKLPHKVKNKGVKPQRKRFLAVLLNDLGYNQRYISNRLGIAQRSLAVRINNPLLFTMGELLILSEVLGIPLSKVIFLSYGFEPFKPQSEQIWHVKGLTLSSFDDLVRKED